MLLTRFTGQVRLLIMSKKIIVLSLGGSLIIPKEGFNLEFLRGFKKIILKNLHIHRFIIVCGGGQTARNYQKIARDLGDLAVEDIDWIGIHATRLNAHFLRTIFRSQAHPVVIKNPTKKEKWKEPILIAAGWKPGFSTDFDAVKLAKLYGSKKVINLSNIEYVYDKDPNKFADARKMEKMSWKDYRKMVGNVWEPGANWPFDPVASREAQKNKMQVIVMNGTNLAEVTKAISGRPFRGTVLKDN